MKKTYICIDLKSFYASVECRERNLDPMKTNLVVADKSRTEKTICLAVTPSLKSFGIPGRARLFEVVQKVRNVNYERKKKTKYNRFRGSSFNIDELNNNIDLEVDYIVAPPRMAHYMKYSTDIYNIYLKYIDKEDIYVYSIDEVFADITNYLSYYKMTAEELVTKIIHDVYETTGITATAGIGENMYLAKVAMDIVAKHAEADKYGVRLSSLTEMEYREKLWNHRPLTSFWRLGPGYAKKLEQNRMYTMGDVARCSVENEDLLYKLFGVNAELLIDHAWGWEPCTIKDIKSFKPTRNSVSEGQVLHCPYTYDKTKIIIKEMSDALSMNLLSKNLVTDQLVLTVGYDIDNLTDPRISSYYKGEVVKDHYGRLIPKHAHGTINIPHQTYSSKIITKYMLELFERIINKDLLVRRINVVASNVIPKDKKVDTPKYEQIDLFSDYNEVKKKREEEEKEEQIDSALQKTLYEIKNKYGKNAILKAMNLEEGATAKDRNRQIGGHQG